MPIGLRRSVQTALSIVEDVVFDRRFGVDTLAQVPHADTRGLVGDSAVGARDYHPTRGRHLRKLWRVLDLPPGLGLLDVGCGKGLVLMRASAEPFSRIVGVEFAASLVAVAEQNLARFRQRRPEAAPIEVVHADAATYEIPADLHVIYLFNPFSEAVLERVMDQVRASHAAVPRPMWVVMNKAHFHATVCGGGVFSRTRSFAYGSAEFHVYQTAA